MPPPAIAPVPFVSADAALTGFVEHDTDVTVGAFFSEYVKRDETTGLPKAIGLNDTVFLDSNVYSLTIGIGYLGEGGGDGTVRILLFS